LALWVPLGAVTFHAGNSIGDTAVWAIVGGSACVLATLTLGFIFGATRRAVWLWVAIPVGSFAQTFGYSIFAQSTAPPDVEGSDIALGLGAIVLSVPIFLAVLITIWVGGGIGLAVAKKRGFDR